MNNSYLELKYNNYAQLTKGNLDLITGQCKAVIPEESIKSGNYGFSLLAE